jgi:hypothetical protein
MLTIRLAQIAVLARVEVQKFEVWMTTHLEKFFPAQSAAMGDLQLLAFIRYGIEHASHYGFRAKRDVCKYIDLMVVFGRDFDTDKNARWAADILARRGDPSARMQLLFTTAHIRLRKR